MKTPNIFISHQWRYDSEYHKLKAKFREKGWNHLDYSVPQHDSFNLFKKREIAEALEGQVKQCNIFIVFARLASGNSEWIQKEVEYAQKYNKYSLGIKPYGYNGGIPIFIQNACHQIIGFNSSAIINRIEAVLSN